MALKTWINKIFALFGYTINRLPVKPMYDQDGMQSYHNHDFMFDQKFRKAYERGILAAQADYRWHWRVHVGLWADYSASRLKGDFIECGVNRGFLSSAIMEFLGWDSLDKTFYLMDTFAGLNESYASHEELEYAKHLGKDVYLHWENSHTERISQQKSLPFGNKNLSSAWMNFFLQTLG